MRNDINRLEPESQQTYESIRSSIVTAQHKIASAVNSSIFISHLLYDPYLLHEQAGTFAGQPTALSGH